MTNKEIDVKKCVHYDKDCFWHCGNPATESYKCKENFNCYFKQLKRKEQECEELKDKLKIYEKMFDNSEFRVALTDIRTGERDIREQRDKRLAKENDRYRKALEEIEEIVNETCTDSQSDCKSCNFSCEHKDILDIINKAKDTTNE